MSLSFVRTPRLRSAGGGEPARKVTWLELFFDLVFVAAVAQVGTPLSTEYSMAGLGRYALLFVLIWSAWNGHTMFSTRFDTDDLAQRGLTLVQMFAVAVMAVNAKDALDSRSSAGFAAAYAVVRLVLAGQYLRVRHVAESRALATAEASGVAAAATLWLASSLVSPPLRFWLWGLALLVDLVTPLVTARHAVRVPPHAAHLPERFGLFTIILVGESMAAVMKGMESQEGWSVPAAASAFLGMGMAFAIWWWYFDSAGAVTERRIRTRRDAWTFQVWVYAHLPLYLGVAVAGVGVEHIISIAQITRLHDHEAWILCGALGTAMAALATVAVTAASESRRPRARRVLPVQFILSGLTVGLGAAGHAVPPVSLMVMLVGLCAVQAVLSACLNRPAVAVRSQPVDSLAESPSAS